MKRNTRLILALVVVLLAIAVAVPLACELRRSPTAPGTTTTPSAGATTTTSRPSTTEPETVSTTATTVPGPVRTAADLQALIDAAEPGDTVLAPPGTYQIPAGAPLLLRSGVTYDFRSAALVVEPNAQTHYFGVLAQGVSDFKLMLGTLQGDRKAHSGEDGEWGHALGILGCSDFTVQGGTISDAWGDGIYLGADGATQNTNGTLSYLTVYGNRRNNISVISLVGGELDSLTLLFASGSPPQAGLDIEPNAGARARDIVISDVYALGNVGDQIVVSRASIGSDDEAVPQGITFQRCLAQGMGSSEGYGFYMNGEGVTLTDCWAANNPKGSFRADTTATVNGGDLRK